MAEAGQTHPNQANSLIDSDLIDVLLNHKRMGHRLMFMRAHNGHIKVKVNYGPFKCRVMRYETNHSTFEQLKQEIASAN